MKPQFIHWTDGYGNTYHLNVNFIESMSKSSKGVRIYTIAPATNEGNSYEVPNTTIETILERIGTLSILVGDK